MTCYDIETPAVLLDQQVAEANTEKIKSLIKGTSMKLFPHYKSHKCTAIALWQMENGASGITCAKLSEAEDLAEAGIPRIVLANQVVQPSKVQRVARLARMTRLSICVDNADNVLALAQACQQEGTKLGVLIELDVGMKRCGVDSFEAFAKLARLVLQQPSLHFEGIQAYAGQLSHEADAALRHSEMLRIEKYVASLNSFLEETCGIPVSEICGGSTGTVADKPKDTVYTELQVGSYLFMDASYGRLSLCFEQSMFILTTVISVSPDRAVLDIGAKSLPMDQEPPYLAGHPDAPLIFNEEHTILMHPDPLLRIGDQLLLVPGHCCTTNNCFNELYLMNDGKITKRMSITSRGKAQ